MKKITLNMAEVRMQLQSEGGSSWFFLVFSSYDNNMLFECLLSANVCLVTLLSSEQSSRLERFRLELDHKTSRFKTKLIGNNAEVSRVNRNAL